MGSEVQQSGMEKKVWPRVINEICKYMKESTEVLSKISIIYVLKLVFAE